VTRQMSILFQSSSCDTRCNVSRRNLITGLTSAASPRLHISSTCKVGRKLGVSLPLLTCSPSAWPSRLLYRRGRKSRRDLWITLYMLLLSSPSLSFYSIITYFSCINSINNIKYNYLTTIKRRGSEHLDSRGMQHIVYVKIFTNTIAQYFIKNKRNIIIILAS
jgi:hypothetical protein